MNSQEIVDYVMNTPHNTNPAILKSMIDTNSSGGSAMKNIITQTEDYQMSANFTVAEVKAQIEAGVCPTLYIYQVADGMYVPCDGMTVTDEEIYFSYKQLHISADGRIWYDQ